MAKTLTLTLLIDKSQNRVIFAESDHRFIDILFSFLTLPLATIIRLLNKESPFSSLNRLYTSVETLDSQYLQTDFCKSMLLRPKSMAGAECENLAINIDDSQHRVYYKCSKGVRCGNVSGLSGVKCERCGGCLDVPVEMVGVRSDEVSKGVFVKEGRRYMVSDDLKVRAVSMSESLGLLREGGIEDVNVLEKREVEIGEEKILNLLKRSLVSKRTLTDVFLQDSDTIIEEMSVQTAITRSRLNRGKPPANSKRISIKLYLSTDSDKVVYAETGEDFVDLLFSFLTFPLGSVIKLMENYSLMECIDNLYESVEVLSRSDMGYIKSDKCKRMLLDPTLPPYFGCQHQLLSISEVPAHDIRTSACKTCEGPTYKNQCCHGMYFGVYSEMNPKKNPCLGNSGQGYAREMLKFMVTDEMAVTPLSPISGCHIIKKLMVPISSLEEAESSFGEAEALDLLKACLMSPTALSDVFSPYPVTLLQQNWFGRLPRKHDGF